MRVQRGRLDSPFFRSKFRLPAAPEHFVRRERLVSLLDDLADYPVTAVVAPAGAGKTALCADWVRHSARPSAWLALDDSDRDPAQFCAAIVAAVDALVPGVADRVAGRPGDDDLRLLADELDGVDAPVSVLVLDDVHRVDDQEACREALESFVEHKPDWLHLVLLSRRRPPLRVDRLRANGALADIGFDVLRFSDDEALAMLAGLCPDTDAGDLPPVADWADGWAAALQLAALAVRSRRAVLPGSDQLVDSYVWHEVLRTERPELVGLLLSTAVVDRMNYGLAEALTGSPDAGDLLLEAEERGLFVSRLDPGGWFEVHGLVREMLLAELERRWPERLRQQHRRAARWFEDTGDDDAALEHWLGADEPAEALRLLASIVVGLVDRSRTAVVERVLQRIPGEVSRADQATRVQDAWCRLLTGAPGADEALAAAAEGSDPSGRLDLLRALAAGSSGEWRAVVELAGSGLDRLGDGAPTDPIGRFGWSILVHAVAADEAWSDGDDLVESARRAVTGDGDGRLAQETARALGLALAGHPLDAIRVAAGVRPVVEGAGLATHLGTLDLAEAVAARELGDRDTAEVALQGLLPAPVHPSPYRGVVARLELAEARLTEGDVQAAEALLLTADRLGCDRARVARTGVLVALARQDLTAAERWAAGIEDPFWRPLSDARVHLAAGRADRAVVAVHQAEPRCTRHRVVRELVLARALIDADRDQASKAVEVAVDLAAEHGLLQSVACEGPAVLELIELAAWRVPDAWLDRLRRSLAPETVPAVPARRLVEDLTERERDVLRFLPSRLTLREIAGELFVSPNTLKFHLRVIYRKLGVNSRAEAVETARLLRLLPRR